MTPEMSVPPNSGDETRAHSRRANEGSMVSGRRMPSNGNGKAPNTGSSLDFAKIKLGARRIS